MTAAEYGGRSCETEKYTIEKNPEEGTALSKWTPQQENAIHSPSRKIICSAAAGSGKTAVMIERVVRLLRERAAPESFLVVTFTNAAASEMKQKIRNRLREERQNKYLRTALEKIPVSYSEESFKIAFNARYLYDVIRNVYTEEMCMRFNSSVSPCTIAPVEGDAYTYLVLPVRVLD